MTCVTLPVSGAVTRDEVTGEEAFDGLIAPLIGAGYRLAYGMLQDSHAAEDVVQEAALRAWRHLHTLRPEADPAPWFLTIVANRCRSLSRTRWWSVVRTSEPPQDAPAAAEPLAGTDLRAALGRLNAHRRLVVVLHYYLDLPLEAVAEVTGAPLGTVKSRLHRALRDLRVDGGLAEEAPA